MAELAAAGKAGRGTTGGRGDVFVMSERCKGCGFCVEFCPTHVLEMAPAYNSRGYHFPAATRPEACTGCDLCGMYCPDFAIHGAKRGRRTAGRGSDGEAGATASRRSKAAS